MTRPPREEALGLGFADGAWRGSLRAMTVEIAGDREGPDRAHLSAARAVLERLEDLALALSAHLGEAEVEVVPDDAPPFTVRHPGPPQIAWVSVDATTPGRPDLVEVAFVTGYPDASHVYVASISGPEIEAVIGRLR